METHMLITKTKGWTANLWNGMALLPAGIVAVAALSTPVHAENAITVSADHARVVNVAGEPAAIIVGNPTFADVSVRNGKLVIHGRHFGSTNVVVLDDAGEQLANFELNVTRKPTRAIVMFKAGNRESYTCAPKCEATLSVGDSEQFFSKMVQPQISGKTEAAAAAAKLAE